MFSLGPWKSWTPHKLWGRFELVELHILIRCETYYLLFLLRKVRTEVETCLFHPNIHFYSHKKEKQNGFHSGSSWPKPSCVSIYLVRLPVNKPPQMCSYHFWSMPVSVWFSARYTFKGTRQEVWLQFIVSSHCFAVSYFLPWFQRLRSSLLIHDFLKKAH